MLDIDKFLNELPDGWRIAFGEKLYNDLLIAVSHLEEPEDFKILEIKEKYGTLRIYCSYESEEILEVLQTYEDLSYHTCIICGALASNYMSYMPMCDKCREEIYKPHY